MKTLLILISFLFLTNANVMHQNTRLQIDKNGNIVGLPNKFSPAKFDISNKTLRIKNRIINFPECITNYFEEHKEPKLNLSASWYHSKDIMPYYLNFDISDKNVNYRYSILVNLETLELLELEKSTQKENSTLSEEIKLDKDCLKEYKNRIRITY